MEYTDLNYVVAPSAAITSDAWVRVLSRLGDYTGCIVQALNMRPHQVSVLAHTRNHILVRISTPDEHLVLRIAPEGHLLCEVFFGRMMARQQLPAARIVYYDLKRTLVPFDYTIERYVCGIGAHRIDPGTPHLLRAVARQTGRILRRMHRMRVPGWGNPSASGRWLTPDWQTVLENLHEKLAPVSIAAQLFNESEQAVVATALEHPALYAIEPCLMHGAIEPAAVQCTIGDHAQVEAVIHPGSVVGGDGLLDLARGILPSHPEYWRSGLLEGYGSLIPLQAAEQERLRLLCLLSAYWNTCQHYALGEPYEIEYEYVLQLLADQELVAH